MALDKTKNADWISKIRLLCGQEESRHDAIWNDNTITVYKTSEGNSPEKANIGYLFKEDPGLYNIFSVWEEGCVFYIVLGTVPTLKNEGNVYTEWTGA